MKIRKVLVFILIILIILFLGFILVSCTEIYNVNKILNNSINKEDWISVSDVDISDVSEDIIGYLSIPGLSNSYYINMPIKDSVELNVLATAIGHFTETPYTNGNICLAAHNSGTNKNGQYVGYFDSIKNLKEGDYISYNNLSNTYTYKVISNTIINETDISVLDNTEENKLTLITCVKGTKNRPYRQCVVAIRVD